MDGVIREYPVRPCAQDQEVRLGGEKDVEVLSLQGRLQQSAGAHQDRNGHAQSKTRQGRGGASDGEIAMLLCCLVVAHVFGVAICKQKRKTFRLTFCHVIGQFIFGVDIHYILIVV